MTTAKLLGLALLASASLVPATAGAAPVADGGRKFTTPMSGPEEVGGGDADGTATGSITVNVGQNRVCWEFTDVNNITAQHRAHIHKQAPGVNGPIVVNFFNLAVGQQGPLTGCTTEALSRPLLIDIIQNPQDYYLNLHNEPFPGGAVRGQLEKK